MREFKSLRRTDRKARIAQAKAVLKEFKAQKKAAREAAAPEPSTNTVLLVILAILLPPLAVALHEGGINGKFWLSLLLTLLFWIPGVIYALIVVLS
ncbi:YqaE/Pmp3 family membrane protein [Sediminibacterium sp. WSJ-3]|nr:YqaE/Pmp3 family membrane protein [Sediminibacterium soli]